MCRCGFDGPAEIHPCHAMAYKCARPAKRRLYNVKLVPLAGMQLKVQAIDTWACDICWNAFLPKITAQNESLQD